MADTLLQITRQEAIEAQWSRKGIDQRIREEVLAHPDTKDMVDHGVQLLTEWCNATWYDSKVARVNQLKQLELRPLVLEILVGIAHFQEPELFTSVTAQLAGRLGFSDKADAIHTVAEIVAVLCLTDAFDIGKADRMASLMVQSRLPLSQELLDYIEGAAYLPPMVCEPLELTSNYDSGYLSHKESLVLGKGNHHEGDLCLDVLNTCNRVALRFDPQFLSKVEDVPTYVLDTTEKADQWRRFTRKRFQFCTLLYHHGNEFYLTHKVDKRGRIYAQGYHISTQGTAFNKAMLELANEQVVEGVPA